MAPSTAAWIEARETAAAVLEELGLSAFAFEVEPQGSEWRVSVECASDEGWAVIALRLPALGTETVRRQVTEQWRARLAVCRGS